MMFGSFERMVAARYLRPRRQEGFISVIAIFSLLGIMLGVATLIIVMSVMNGFRVELMSKILGFNGDLSAYSAAPGGMPDFDALVGKIRGVPGVTAVTPLVEGEALVSSARGAQGAEVRGERIEDLKKGKGIAGHVVAGSLDRLDDDSVALGYRLAIALGVRVGDRISLLSPNGTATAFGTVPRVKSYQVAATYDVGEYQYDSGYVYTTLPSAQAFFKVPDRATRIEIMVDDPDALWRVEGPITEAVGPDIRLFSWEQSNSAFFNAVETERSVMFLILTLIIVVAAFNVISSMIMLVKDKGRDIAILRTMGATRGMILRIFFMAGASVGVAGTLLGFALGLAFCLNIERIRQFLQKFTGTDLFNAEIYFLSHMPAKLDPTQVTEVVVMALALSFLATIYPSWRAAQLDPIEALRYE
jgi:lipoprotein-releasing system permease protein